MIPTDKTPRVSAASTIKCGCLAAIVAGLAIGCGRSPQASLERLVEARRLAADLLVQFTAGADAANRAVMAETDESSVAFAAEADQAAQAIQRDHDALGAILGALGYADENRLLEEFGGRFAAYRVLDRSILELAVENTNLKAQRLSFGPAREAADAFSAALAPLTSGTAAKDSGRTEALAATAVAAVRDIQVQQAPHIAESDEAKMTALEQRMTISESAARRALASLESVVQPSSRPHLAAASEALTRFSAVNTQIVALSHRNTNVRSLALTLGQKRALTSACEESLQALQDALVKRGFTATR